MLTIAEYLKVDGSEIKFKSIREIDLFIENVLSAMGDDFRYDIPKDFVMIGSPFSDFDLENFRRRAIAGLMERQKAAYEELEGGPCEVCDCDIVGRPYFWINKRMCCVCYIRMWMGEFLKHSGLVPAQAAR